MNTAAAPSPARSRVSPRTPPVLHCAPLYSTRYPPSTRFACSEEILKSALSCENTEMYFLRAEEDREYPSLHFAPPQGAGVGVPLPTQGGKRFLRDPAEEPDGGRGAVPGSPRMDHGVVVRLVALGS